MGIIENLEGMLARGQDSALLRYSLGNEYFKLGQLEAGIGHLARALELDPAYSAAWKLYGKLLAEAGRPEEALEAYASGVSAAEARGDLQAAKEMQVFRRRILKQRG